MLMEKRMDDGYGADRAAILRAWRDLKDGADGPERIALELHSSRMVWSFLRAKQASIKSDVETFDLFHRQIATEFPQSLARTLVDFLREERLVGDVPALENLANARRANHADFGSPWGWLWTIEFDLHEFRRVYLFGDASLASDIDRRILNAAVENQWPGYVCSSCYGLVLKSLSNQDHAAAKRYLAQFLASAKSLDSSYYLSHGDDLKQIFARPEGRFEESLSLARQARRRGGLSIDSDPAQQFIVAELSSLVALGRFKSFRALYAQLKDSHFAAQRRSLSDPRVQHLSIEYLDECLANFELREAANCVSETELFSHVCCEDRVWRQIAALRLLDPDSSAKPLTEAELSKMASSNSWEHDRLEAELLSSQHDFKFNGPRPLNDAHFKRIKLRIRSSPFRRLELMAMKFEVQRLIVNGSHSDAFELNSKTVKFASAMSMAAEAAGGAAIQRALAERSGVVVGSALRDLAKIGKDVERVDAEFASRLLACWPYSRTASGVSARSLAWNAQKSALVANGAIMIPVPAESPVGPIRSRACQTRFEGHGLSRVDERNMERGLPAEIS